MTVPVLRTFLAVHLSLEATQKVAAAAAQLRRRLGERGVKASFVAAENLHVTVRFLGPTREPAVMALRDRMAELVAGRPAFDLGARGVQAWPVGGAPRILVLAIEDLSGGLARVAKDVEAMVQTLGFPAETRPLRPHLTLARVKDVPEGVEVSALLSESPVDAGVSRVRELVLYESRLDPRGATYVPLVRAPLQEQKGPRQPPRRGDEPGAPPDAGDGHGE